MTASITQFRKDLFQMADHAIRGEIVQFTYKGVVFKVTPEKKHSKLEKLVGQQIECRITATTEATHTVIREKNCWPEWKPSGWTTGLISEPDL